MTSYCISCRQETHNHPRCQCCYNLKKPALYCMRCGKDLEQQRIDIAKKYESECQMCWICKQNRNTFFPSHIIKKNEFPLPSTYHDKNGHTINDFLKSEKSWLTTKTGIIPQFSYEKATSMQRKIYFCSCKKPKRAWQGMCTSCWKKNV